MCYVYKRHIKRQIENVERFVFIWTSFKKAQFQMVRGLQRCLPNEHIDHKENNFSISSSENQSFPMTQTS